MADRTEQALRSTKVPQPVDTRGGILRDSPLDRCMAVGTELPGPRPFEPQAEIVVVIGRQPFFVAFLENLDEGESALGEKVIPRAGRPECCVDHSTPLEG